MTHLVVVSDLHLWQATDHDDLWMRYRHRRFLPDAQFASLVDLLEQQVPNGELALVLNGDIFDFDLPPVVDGHPFAERSPRTESLAVARLATILKDHALFVAALAKLLRRQQRVVFIAGNHDLQLNFAAVRALLIDTILDSCAAADPAIDRAEFASRIEFHAWFYRSAHGVHVEHGNQYDPYCSVSDPEWPFHIDRSLQNNVGTLVLEHLIGKLGYFNPNVDSTFLLTTKEYLDHWLRYYWRSPRSLLRTFFVGTLRIFFESMSELGLHGHSPRAPELQAPDTAAHASLFTTPDLRATMRLLGLDRMLLLLGMLMSLLLLLLYWPLGVVGALLTRWVYQFLDPGRACDVATVSTEVSKKARRIAVIYGARAVVFGHTHLSEGRWESGVFYGNSGTWVPMYQDIACSIVVEESRPVIWLRENQGQLEGGLYRFHNEQLHLATAQPSCTPQLQRSTSRRKNRGGKGSPAAAGGLLSSSPPRICLADSQPSA
jgi:UDP-2,3-diacylglucosamine pyrophosphatase LpxH